MISSALFHVIRRFATRRGEQTGGYLVLGVIYLLNSIFCSLISYLESLFDYTRNDPH